MSASEPPRVTFDTNVCNFIHEPNKPSSPVAPADATAIRAAITDGRLKGFISEASLFVECLSFPEKLAYLAVAGTPDPRPQPDPRTVVMFKDLEGLGMKLLHAPLIGGEIFIDVFDWAQDDRFNSKDRLARFFAFTGPLPRHKPLEAYGNALMPAPRSHRVVNVTKSGFGVPIPAGWAGAIKQEWDNNVAGRKALEKAIRPDIGEWCDALIVGSHYAYGNDVFCTTDRGVNAGSRSLLHKNNRAALEAQGIKLVTPEELVQQYKLL
ncbi:hypothetical protein [Bradyrhizobium yuanmingense]|uniref:hypothetical protein n=1 Tax=Bradyrhizobium yuanmingense TaxID=108015 RepID=UPI003511AD31